MTRLAKLTALALLAAGLAAAAAPWRVARSTVAAAVGGGLDRTGGLRTTVAGPVTFKLLPRPRIQAVGVTVEAEDGALLLDAPLLKAELDIPRLIRGGWRITSATLVEPTVTVDLDRLAARAHDRDPGRGADGAPAQLRVRGGVLRARSATGIGDMLATGLDLSASWTGGGEDLVVSGTATCRGATAQFAGSLQHPGLSATPAGSSASLQVDSPLFSLAVDGILSGGTQEQFAGRASLSTPSLPHLLRALDGVPPALGAKRAQISGDLVARPHDLSLSNAQLRLDRARFEGTLAWRSEAGRSLVAGTLATDRLDVDALLGDGLDRPALDALYRRPLEASPFGADIDMRVSATTARIGRVTVDDAAIAALVRGERLELTLDEARAYGGLVKARALATLGPRGVEAHADLSARNVDLGQLSDRLSGRERVGGALSGHAALDGRGASLREVVAKLAGGGQLGIEGGRLAGLSLAQALRRLGRHLPLDVDRRGTPTTFDKALWDLSVRDGVVRIPDGKLTAPGVALSFGAETDLPDGRLAVHAVAAQTDAGGTPLRDGQSMPFDMRGSWAGPLLLVGRGAGLPPVSLPLFDGLAAER